MPSLDQRLAKKLENRRKEGILRSLKENNFKFDFYSNDYLGLSKVKTSSSTSFSGTGSRLISGTTQSALNTECFLASTYKSEACLLYNSGYDANLGIISAIPERGDTIIYDELIHASVRDGIKLSNARAVKFAHSNLIDLEKKIRNAKGEVFVLVESIYSMHGDFCDLKSTLEICKKHKAHLIVDEAHAGAVFGKHGGGLVEHFGLEKEIFARLITFGKGFGSHGACILGSKLLIDNLINFSRSFIYTTALPEYSYIRIKEIIETTDFEDLQSKLQSNIRLFSNSKEDLLSPILTITGLSKTELKQTELELQQLGFGIKAIFSPTVPEGEERFRVCIHTKNTAEEIENLKHKLSTFSTISKNKL